MTSRHAKIFTLILLVALVAFVADVLSPATPTPVARLASQSFVVVALVLLGITGFHLTLPYSILHFSGPAGNSRATKLSSRGLITFECLLRC